MPRKYLILPLLLLVAACVPDQIVEKPNNLIKEEQFVEVLCDIHLADAVLSNQRLHDKNLTDTSASYYNYIYIKHSITRYQFNQSLKYYSADPENFDKMYRDVVSRMEKLANKLNSN